MFRRFTAWMDAESDLALLALFLPMIAVFVLLLVIAD